MERTKEIQGVRLVSGEYKESINLSKNLTISGHRCDPKDCCIISDNATTITFSGKQAKIANLSLKVEDKSNFFHCLVVENGVLEVEACEMLGGAWGLCINNRAHAIVRGCQIHDNKGTGVNVYGGARLEMTECEILNNRGRGVSASDSGTFVSLRGNVIQNCSDGVYVYAKVNPFILYRPVLSTTCFSSPLFLRYSLSVIASTGASENGGKLYSQQPGQRDNRT
eukprot:764637-Hanusia_phi.AAC.2